MPTQNSRERTMCGCRPSGKMIDSPSSGSTQMTNYFGQIKIPAFLGYACMTCVYLLIAYLSLTGSLCSRHENAVAKKEILVSETSLKSTCQILDGVPFLEPRNRKLIRKNKRSNLAYTHRRMPFRHLCRESCEAFRPTVVPEGSTAH